MPGRLFLLQEAWLLRARARALVAPPKQPETSEIHVFVVWSNAVDEAPRILADVERRFSIRDVLRIHWRKPLFSWNLTRFYGGLLPPNAEKETHCGSDPFLVVVVEDRQPVYAPRRTPKGIVNASMFDAKQRYRAWTGGGHRIHATLDRDEAEHDLYLLLKRRTAFYARTTRPWAGSVTPWFSDVIGADGWADTGELLSAIEVSTPYVLPYGARPPFATAPNGTCPPPRLTLLVRDRVRAALTANSRPATASFDSPVHEVTIDDSRVVLELRRPGDGHLDHRWQRALLRRRVRDAGGAFVPGPPDHLYALLYHTLLDDDAAEAAPYAAVLEELARRESLPSGNVRDRRFARGVLDEYLQRMGYGRLPDDPEVVARPAGRTPGARRRSPSRS